MGVVRRADVIAKHRSWLWISLQESTPTKRSYLGLLCVRRSLGSRMGAVQPALADEIRETVCADALAKSDCRDCAPTAGGCVARPDESRSRPLLDGKAAKTLFGYAYQVGVKNLPDGLTARQFVRRTLDQLGYTELRRFRWGSKWVTLPPELRKAAADG